MNVDAVTATPTGAVDTCAVGDCERPALRRELCGYHLGPPDAAQRIQLHRIRVRRPTRE